ncbi:MAG: heat shock protein HspQ [Gammaproteobacteria bacterium]|nr:heat shock protein HspQ [Gammaproteobacteria bacterium]
MTLDPNHIKIAKFRIGDQVVHQQQGYRAVVIDIDPLFQASGRYNPHASKRTFATQHPWYRLLVDNSAQQTYVEEPLLIQDQDPQEISNPHINQFLVLQKGRYVRGQSPH